jgi:hypothetical protein
MERTEAIISAEIQMVDILSGATPQIQRRGSIIVIRCRETEDLANGWAGARCRIITNLQATASETT